MEIKGKIYCFFEQSGTFKNEFRKLGYQAEDYDIQNEFGETDHVMDLFAEIEKCYDGEASVFDNITPNDLIMAFFPCIYFCQDSMIEMTAYSVNYRKLTFRDMADKILKRSEDREYFYKLLIKIFSIVKIRGLKMIVENPWTQPGYLNNNFLFKPTIIDRNRMLRGDYYVKPTAYWFVNCEPTYGRSFQKDKKQKTIMSAKSSKKTGICSMERSLISPDYVRNFICDFIIGKKQKITEQTLF
ncbi:hypothetical protein [Prevotella sp. HUN102]|uniref:hypothetical protein n=1 Tax=Prevotella sp. HUN102 TaxID=1392486 RepID=UPI000490AE97|nr:hypothetical protein [Prevotella sp. HUN102]